MREIKLNTIEIAGESYPIYCDLYVLEQIQERMSLNQFERDLIGAVPEKDNNGKIKRKEDGTIKLVFDEYKIKSIMMALTLMINEGINIENEVNGKELEPVNEKYIMRVWQGSLAEVSKILHDEFNRCFEVKKNTDPVKPENRKRKTSRSTLRGSTSSED